MKLGKTLKEQIKFCGLSLREVSDRIGVSYNTVQNWAKDSSSPSIEDLYRVCLVLDCTIDDLLDWAGYQYEPVREVPKEEEPWPALEKHEELEADIYDKKHELKRKGCI